MSACAAIAIAVGITAMRMIVIQMGRLERK
jgi:hypothetical protein